MQVSVTFRNVEPTETLKEHAAEKVARIERYVHAPTDAHIVLSVEKHLHKADITIKGHGMLMRGKEKTEDMYASIDRAVDKIERQVKRYKNKLSNHKPRQGASAKVTLNYLDALSEPEPKPTPVDKVISRREIEVNTMSVEEAIMQMDLINNDFYVFINANSGDMNVIYRRGEDGFGVIEAPR